MIPEDVIAMAKVVLPHRLVLTAEARMARVTGAQVTDRAIAAVKVPGLS